MDEQEIMPKMPSVLRGPISNETMQSPPLVVLLDGRDHSVELPLLKDVATLHVCKAQNASELEEKVFNEAVGALVSNTFVLTKEDLEKFQKLRIITIIGSSVDNVDLKAAGELGIAVCNVPRYGVEDVADVTLCLILNLYRRTCCLANMVGEFKCTEEMMKVAQCLPRIRGSSLGIVGLGRIGTAVALRAKAFGFRVIFYDPYVLDDVEKSLGLLRVHMLEDILFQSDCISLHCTLNEFNHNLINEITIRYIRPGSFLVNTASGGLVNGDALATALVQGRIRAAALDVHVNELYNVIAGPLKEAPNLLCRPHGAFFSAASDSELREMAALEMKKAIKGGIPKNFRSCVNTEYFLPPRDNLEGLASPENYYQEGTPNVQQAHSTSVFH